MEYLINHVLLFFLYSFLGWCIEVTLKFIQYHRFINRGFLTGPICPIYGTGAVLITIVMDLLPPTEYAIGTTFIVSLFLCGMVEYLTSYFMEKQFHARWWDYSKKPMNLHGRVWIGNLILFGLGGVGIIHIINPAAMPLIASAPLLAREINAACFLLITGLDYLVTHFILKLIKTHVEKSEADNTEAINHEVKLLLSDRNIFYRRFAEAYPEVIYRTDRINTKLAEIKAETERLREEAEQRLDERRTQLADSMEPSLKIQSTLIEEQDRLISQTYDESTATEEMKALKADIERNKQRLKNRPLSKLLNRP